jgi:GNAT superfamily N-acetyltransferase
MSAKIIQIADLQARYSGSYQFTVTTTPDPDYRSYLARQLRGYLPPVVRRPAPDAQPLDISLDDIEGDVVAGLAADIVRDTLFINMLWVGEPLRGRGLGRRLLQMAEEKATGCVRARGRVMGNVAFFVGAAYRITGTVQAIPFQAGRAGVQAIYWLEKDIARLYD